MSLRNILKRIVDQFKVNNGGIAIAILAAFLTFSFSQYQENQQDKKNYEGLLYVIHVEMVWQKNHFLLLRNTLSQLKKASTDSHSFIIQDSPMQFNLAMLETSLTKVIEYKKFNHKLVLC